MNKQIYICIVTACVCIFSSVNAQTTKSDTLHFRSEERVREEWEELADELLDDGEISDYESWWQRLEEIKLSPFNLNTVGYDSLNMLGLLSDRQIENILQFRKDYGGFMNVNELLLVNGVGIKQLGALKPLLYVDSPEFKDRISAIKRGNKQEALLKLKGIAPQSRGLKDNRYPGAPFGTLVKYKASLNNRWSASLVAESDPGEKFFTNSQRAGFDFISAHIAHTSDRVLSQWVLGDFQVQWGQGLVAWQGFSSGGSSSIATIEKSGRGFQPYSSSGEYGYFRGGAISLKLSNALSLGVFASYNKLDGKIEQLDTLSNEDDYATSLYQTGMHRTETERKGKRNIDELALGGTIILNNARFRLQAHYLHYNLTPPIIIGNKAYQKYNDTGKQRNLYGVAWKTAILKAFLFGEVAISDNGSTAIIAGIRRNFKPINIGITYRRYDKHYISTYAGGMGAYGNTSNEEGATLNMELSPSKKWQIRAGADYFHFFASRYRATIPDYGLKLNGEALYKSVKNQHSLSLKYTQKAEEISEQFPAHRNTLTLKYQLSTKYNKKWESRARIQLAQTRKDSQSELGIMISGDGIYTSSNEKFKTQMRLAYFNTKSYYSRIYLYENNVLYGYSTPAFQGEGWRWYANISYKPTKNLTCYAKIGITTHPGEKSWGNGADLTNGSTRSDIVAQLRYTF